MTEYYLQIAKRLFPETVVAERCLNIPPSALQESLALLPKSSRPFVGFGFGASFGSAKMWPKDRYAELICKIADRAEVVLLGAESDREVEREILRLSGGKAVSLVGKTNLLALSAVMSRLGLYITNDTGPMHIAAGLGVPTIAIFGPTSPEETKPIGSNVHVIRHKADCAPCFKRQCPTDHRCMTAVAVEEVLWKALDVIGQTG
jgi:heptosyltransferase-2